MGPVLKMGKGRKEKRGQELKPEKREKQQQDQTAFRKETQMGNMSPCFPRDRDLITTQSTLINKHVLH